MLKQLSYALAAAALLGTTLASCSSDEPGLLNADGNVTFSVQLPADMATRATDTGAGLSATKLTAAVYQTANGTSTLVDTKTATFANLTSQVEFQLVKGAAYTIVFFADAPTGSPYSFNTVDGTMSVTYPNSYAETNDCFYKALPVTVTTGYTGEAVTLTRPVAQLNVGTNDLAQALAAGVYTSGVTVKSTVKGVANSLNMLTGEASGSVNAESTATMNDTYAGLNFPYEPTTYSYLAMGYYLLPGQVSGNTTSGTYDCEFQLMSGSTNIGSPILSSATPMQANYRTNIYGALLSTGVIYGVTIEPAFGGGWENGVPSDASRWDGQTLEDPVVDNTAQTVDINNANQFAKYLSLTEAGADPYQGFAVRLNANVDMQNHPLAPTHNAEVESGQFLTGDHSFQGVFDGQGKTIANLTVNPAKAVADKPFGVFCGLRGANTVLKNITFYNLNINPDVATKSCGVVGVIGEGARIENVKVQSGSITGSKGAGGIAGGPSTTLRLPVAATAHP